MIFSVPLRLTLEKLLPSSFYENHIKPSIYGWEFRDKNVLHEKIGPAFLLVSSGDTELWVAHPDAAQAVMARRKDFVQAPIATKILSVLGPNILSVSLSSHHQLCNSPLFESFSIKLPLSASDGLMTC
jgi:hypothetical protein